MKRYFLYVFLLVFIVGFLFLTGVFDLNKIKPIFSNLNSFTATIAPDSSSFESSEINPGSLLVEKESTILAAVEKEAKPTLSEIQEVIDDIAEKIDIISQKVAELVGEIQEVQDEDKEKKEPIEEEQEEQEEPDEEEEQLEEELEEEKKEEKKKPKRRSVGGGGSPSQKSSYSKILISELQISGQDDKKEEFVELYNPNGMDIELTNWYVQRKTAEGSNFSTFAPSKLFSGKTIRARNYFLIARENSSFTDLADIIIDYPLTENNTLVLKDPNREVKDKVGWGSAQDFEAVPAENPLSGQSIGRKWVDKEYQDKDNNSEDFEIQKPTPKTKNSPLPLPQPILEVSLEIIEFSIMEFDTAPQNKIFTISNIGEGILEWEGIIEYDSSSLGAAVGWLEIEPNSGLISTDTPSDVLIFPDISNLIPGTYSAKIIITDSAAEGVFKEIKVNLIVIEKVLEDITFPEVIFNIEIVQTSLSFTISWIAIDPIGNVTPSGLEAFYLQYSVIDTATSGIGEILQYQDQVKGWQDWEIGEILELGEEKDSLALLGKDEYTYCFQIKAKDKAGNFSEWQKAEATINLPKTVLISEVQIADDEFVELYNFGEQNVDVSNWYFSYFPATLDDEGNPKYSWNNPYRNPKFPEGAIISIQNYYLIGLKGYSSIDGNPNADWQPYSSSQLSNEAGAIAIFSWDPKTKTPEEAEEGRIDALGWGKVEVREGEAVFFDSPSDLPMAKSLTRKCDLETQEYQDTNNNQNDFEIKDPTPTNSNNEGKGAGYELESI